MKGKRADIGLGVILVIIIVVLFFGWLINEGWKECRVNSDCKTDQYCGSDFGCHDLQVIKQSASASPPVNYTAVAWIIGLCLIIAAIIMKWDTIFSKRPIIITKKKNVTPDGYVILGKHKSEEKGLFEDELQKEE